MSKTNDLCIVNLIPSLQDYKSLDLLRQGTITTGGKGGGKNFTFEIYGAAQGG